MFFEISLILFLTLISAAFSSTESAIFSLDSSLIQRSKQSVKNKIRLQWIRSWLKTPEKTLSAILLGNLAANIILSEIGYGFISRFSNAPALDTSLYSLLIITSFLLIFCEILPKAISIQIPKKWSLNIAPALRIWLYASDLIAMPVTKLTQYITSRMPDIKNKYDEKELLNSIQLALSYGLVDEKEERILKRSVIFYHDTVYNVMIPRSRVFMLPHRISIVKARKEFIETNNDFAVIYHSNTQKIIGSIHIRSITLLYHKNKKSLRSKMQSVFFLPQTIPLNQAVQELIQRQAELAIIVDESGEFSGVLTLKNILKKLVGEWQDESQGNGKPGNPIRKVDHKVFRVYGFTEIVKFNEFFSTTLNHEEIETISGYIIYHLDGFPKPSTSFKLQNLYIYDMKMRGNILESFLVRVLYER